MRFYTSPTVLQIAAKCERCAFDHTVLKHKRPRGAYPSLPNGIDRVFKHEGDHHAKLGTEVLPGLKLHPDREKVTAYREWNGLCLIRKFGHHELVVNGGIDDLLVDKNGIVWILDGKSKDKAPPDDYGELYYKETLEVYHLLLRAQGERVSDTGILWYWYPAEEAGVDGKPLTFDQKILRVMLDPGGADRVLRRLGDRIAELPKDGKNLWAYRPKPTPECEYCAWSIADRGYDEGVSQDPF